jgi:hypothetical protein
MPANPPHIAGRSHVRRCAAAALLAVVLPVGAGAIMAAEPVPSRLPAEPSADVAGGLFLPAADGGELWRQTVATVAADWPVVRVVEPGFTAVPPRAGIVESAWIEPPGASLQSWPPRRQRVVVTFVPAVNGAWIDAVVQSQSLSGEAAGGTGIELMGSWQADQRPDTITTQLAARMAPATDPIYALPPLDQEELLGPAAQDPPWGGSRFPRTARAGYKVLEDYRNFYSCDGLVCLTAAFGAGALMANTGFDTTMQGAWQTGVEPTGLGTFFSGCKPIGEGKYALPVFGAAALTGLVFEGNPFGDVVGEWGSRSLRMFVVGAPPLYALQWATGGSRPDESSAGSDWHFFNDNNGVSGHAFVGAIPFLAAADMVESPLLKGTLYVCSTFVGFSRMTDNAHYPSQVFLGWYLAWASSVAVSRTEVHFSGMEVRVVPLPIADLGGAALEARW